LFIPLRNCKAFWQTARRTGTILKTRLTFIYTIRDFLQTEEFKNLKIEVSNRGHIRINGKEATPYEKNKDYFYVRLNEKTEYPDCRLVAGTWCEFQGDTDYCLVYHIINDGEQNYADNLVWIKEADYMSLRHQAK